MRFEFILLSARCTRLVSALSIILLFSLPQASPAASPKAADLVKNGQPIDLHQPKYRALFKELEEEHKFSSEELKDIFKGQVISKQVLELMDHQWESKPYYKYSPLFITSRNIATGKQKLLKHRPLLDRIEEQFGVDREIIVAIWAIETRYGTNLGGFNVLQTLNTLFDAYPRRSSFFRSQLIHFLVLCKENNLDPRSMEGSYAGAFGQNQFIPSSFQAYAVSFDGNEQRDVWNSIPDVLASIANYLKRFHWTLHGPIFAELGSELQDNRLIAAKEKGRKGRVDWQVVRDASNRNIPPSPGNRPLSIVALELDPQQSRTPFRYIAGYPNFQAITEWNHSNRYAMAVTELAAAFKQ